MTVKRFTSIKVITYAVGYSIAIAIAVLGFALGWWAALASPAG